MIHNPLHRIAKLRKQLREPTVEIVPSVAGEAWRDFKRGMVSYSFATRGGFAFLSWRAIQGWSHKSPRRYRFRHSRYIAYSTLGRVESRTLEGCLLKLKRDERRAERKWR